MSRPPAFGDPSKENGIYSSAGQCRSGQAGAPSLTPCGLPLLQGSGLSTTSSAGKTLADQMDRISKANLARLREHSEYVPGKKGKKVHLSSNSTFYDMQS